MLFLWVKRTWKRSVQEVRAIFVSCKISKNMKELKELKVGDFFKLKPTGRVYVRGEYVRSLKRYSYYDFDDVCREHFAKGSKRVIVNFEF